MTTMTGGEGGRSTGQARSVDRRTGITVVVEGERLAAVRGPAAGGAAAIAGRLVGRRWDEVPQLVSRTCPVCSAAHALTAVRATERAFGVRVSEQTGLLRDLLWRAEMIACNARHLYLLAAPDYLDYPSARALAADRPEAWESGLRLRRLAHRIKDAVGGRGIHPVNVVAGGFGRTPDPAVMVELRLALEQARLDARRTAAEAGALSPHPRLDADIAFAALRPDTGYRYADGEGAMFVQGCERWKVLVDRIDDATPERAGAGPVARRTLRDGTPVMVGTLARMTVNRDRITGAAETALEEIGLPLLPRDPLDIGRAQAVELVLDVEEALHRVDELLAVGPEPERAVPVEPRASAAAEMTEAPAGLLLHRLAYDAEGRVVEAELRTPATYNAPSMEYLFARAVAQLGADHPARLERVLTRIARAHHPCIPYEVRLLRR